MADFSEDGDSCSITRYYINTNYTDTERPKLSIDFNQKVKHYFGNPISGMCLNQEDKELFFAVPTQETIFINRYDDDTIDDYRAYAGNEDEWYP